MTLLCLSSIQPLQGQWAVVGTAVVLVAILAVYLHMKRQTDGAEHAEPETVDAYVAAHGEPDDVIVLDATRSGELLAVVLVYPGEMIIDGQSVKRDAVTSVTFNNAAVPYMNNQYQLVISTTLPDRPTIKVDVGDDAGRASETAQQMAQHIFHAAES